jgi:hypothetical protein
MLNNAVPWGMNNVDIFLNPVAPVTSNNFIKNSGLRLRKGSLYAAEKNYKYHNSGHYPSVCLLFETHRFGEWVLSPSSGGT